MSGRNETAELLGATMAAMLREMGVGLNQQSPVVPEVAPTPEKTESEEPKVQQAQPPVETQQHQRFEVRTPPIPIEDTIGDDFIICLEDMRRMKSLKRHLKSFGLSPDEYRRKWGLPADYPMICHNLAESRRNIALKSGLGRKPQDQEVEQEKPQEKAQTENKAKSNATRSESKKDREARENERAAA